MHHPSSGASALGTGGLYSASTHSGKRTRQGWELSLLLSEAMEFKASTTSSSSVSNDKNR
eukprot:580593-Pelagomonas_calceolata.AAC.2